MSDAPRKRIWRVARFLFKWTRVIVLFAFFLIVFAFVYMHEVGLPAFIKRPVLQKIRDHGFAVQFSDMRWRWPNRIEIDRPTFSQTNDAAIHVEAQAIDFHVNVRAAARKQLRFDFISLGDARVVLPVSRTNDDTVTLTNIQAAVRVTSDNVLRVERLGGTFDGAEVEISGVLTNYLAAFNWELFHRKEAPKIKRGKPPLQRFTETWRQLKFSHAPKLDIHVGGDATDLTTVKVDVDLSAKARTETPWATVDNLHLHSSYGDGNEAVHRLGDFHGEASRVETAYANGNDLRFSFAVFPDGTNVWRSDMSFAASHVSTTWSSNVDTNWVKARSLKWSGTVVSTTNAHVLTAKGHIELLDTETRWGELKQARGQVEVARNTAPAPVDASWGLWTPFAGWLANGELEVAGVTATNVTVTHARVAADWHAPRLTVKTLEGELYGGTISSAGTMDVATRKVEATMKSQFDVHYLEPLLPVPAQRWLNKFTWQEPPAVAGTLNVVLPSWTNRQPDWRGEVLPTVEVVGTIAVTNGSYRKVPVNFTRTDFAFSNVTWTLPNLRVVRPEGTVDLTLSFNKKTGENHWRIDSGIDPKAIAGWFGEEAQGVMNKISLGGPPQIHAEISERNFDFSKCSMEGHIVATNVGFRGLELDRVETSFALTNKLITLSNVKANKDNRIGTSSTVEVDLALQKVSMHEVYSTLDPYIVTKAIGRKVFAAIEPYQFTKPPTVYIEGSFVFDHPETGDMHFLVEGEDFRWGVLRADKASAKVDWIGPTLYVTNINATAYRGGHADAWVFVDFRTKGGNNFQVGVAFTNIDAQAAMVSLNKKTRLEGTLHGKVNITAANTKSYDPWQGYGWVQLQDGLIWEVPIFGLFSPVLNALAPGSGNSRAREAEASFTITNGIIHSDDLVIRSTAVRISYHGDIALEDQQVKAYVEAQLLRDAGSLGHLVSIAFEPFTKLFEYKVTGTLDDPKSEPVFIPNILMKVLRPFHTLKKMLPEKSDGSAEKPQAAADQPVP